MIHEFHTISFELSNDGIGHLLLNQPPANSMTVEFFREFDKVISSLAAEPQLRAMVISGKGRHFSSGADLEGLLGFACDPSSEAFFLSNYRAFLALEELGIPVVAAIRGVCIGSAFELALFTHFRFCEEDSVFGLPETTFNLVPGIGGISRISRLCGQAKAIELSLKGNTFPAEEALNYHLVDRIVPKRKVVQYAFSFVRSIMNGYQKQKSRLYLQKIQSNEPAFI